MTGRPDWVKDDPCPKCGNTHVRHTRVSGRYVSEIMTTCEKCGYEEVEITIKKNENVKKITVETE